MPNSMYTLTVIFSFNGPSIVSSLPSIEIFAGAGNTEPSVRYRLLYITVECYRYN